MSSGEAGLEDAARRIGGDVVPHQRFEDTRKALERALECTPMALLVGIPGVGKSTVSDAIVRSMNQEVDGSCDRAAVAVTAPAPQSRAFSWKDLWIDTLVQLGDPLPERKTDRWKNLEMLSRGGTRRQFRQMTEGALVRAVAAAATDRRLRCLVVDEAMELVKSGSGRVLRDQLDVLRNLADRGAFGVVLVSTPRILPSFKLSGELARRTTEVVFERYDGAHGLVMFSRVAATFMRMLPEPVRFSPGPEELKLLFQGSIGCVGHLARWFRGALLECSGAGAQRLEWVHFERSAYPPGKLRLLREECARCEDYIREWPDTALGAPDATLQHTLFADKGSGPATRPAQNARVKGRIGIPGPARHRVA